MKLNSLTNPNLNLQEKMRFFADYFLFVNEYLGKLPELPFDNPLSLVDKVIFQIETNIKRCPANIENHFRILFEFYKNTSFSKTLLFQEFESLYNIYRTNKGSDEKIAWIKNNEKFQQNLILLKKEYEETLFTDMFSALYTLIHCPHSLKKHKTDIKFCTHIFVSVFRLSGHPKESVETFIDRILSSEIDKFPLPEEILMLEKNESFKDIAQKFIKNRDFKEQFHGFKNLMTAFKIKKGNFFHVIDNCVIDDKLETNFKVTFDKVTFISPFHDDLKKIRDTIFKKDESASTKLFPIFFDEKKLLAYVTLNYEDIPITSHKSFEIISQELVQFNKYLDSSLSVNPNNFLFIKDFKKDIWQTKVHFIIPFRINSYNSQDIMNNPFQTLKKINSPAKEQILSNERTFFKATNNEVSSFWQYLENLFWSQNFEIDEIIKKVVRILLNQLSNLRNGFLISMIVSMDPFNTNEQITGLNYEEVNKIWKEIIENKNYDFSFLDFESKLKNTFLKDALKYHKDFLTNAQKSKWQLYFKSLISELYEYRNSEYHSGKVNEYSKIKFTEILPFFINKIRWAFIYACEDNPNLSFEEIIDLLSTFNIGLNKP